MACAAYFTPEQLRQSSAFDELEAKITELWGHLNAATYRFLTLVAEFDREKAFERHGLANTAQWLNWQCGIGPEAAREKVRVARSLEQLPEIADAFAKGEISYSKVRAMTRVATAANESVLVHVARHGTAAHVEKLARKFKWTQRRDAAKLAQRQHEQRSVTYFFDIDDQFVLNARLPREIGAVVRKALEAAVEALREPLRKPDDVSAETPLQIAANARRADALRHIAETFLAHHGEATGAGSSADRVQVVVHVDQADTRGATSRGGRAASLRARGRSGARARHGTPARLRLDGRRYRGRRGWRAARHRPQDAQYPCRHQPCAQSA